MLAIVIPPELNPEWKKLREEAKGMYMEGVDEYDRQEVARAYVTVSYSSLQSLTSNEINCSSIQLYSDIFVCNGTKEYAEKMSDLGHKVNMIFDLSIRDH